MGMALIFAGSARSDVGVLGRIPDWITHGAEYALLSVLVTRAMADGLRQPLAPARTLAAVAICAAFGASDEHHQSFVPQRDASVADVAKDAAGALVGAWVRGRWPRVAGTLPGKDPIE